MNDIVGALTRTLLAWGIVRNLSKPCITCQSTCVDSTLASNNTCGTTYTACACDNNFVQNVKICLYQGTCSSDVSTWFDTATAACDASGAEANYTSTHSGNYTYSESAATESTAVASSGAATAATSSAAAASSAAASGSTSAGFSLHPMTFDGIGSAAVGIVGAVLGNVMLL
ncbi:uncharacterized protein IL334_005137 [Kwoniella shivajii]|uniref:Extracellular membrane protein CFEM domain-containing protein n=1 Tax=Kwoniella shivajii TaxID=564305 RepID=A0ABZ1D3I3_9TREE|nr:hypothetical protein IL334_005137 [Kwoniella shivajii]